MSSRLRAPEDGLVASSRHRGWAARRWAGLFDDLAESHHAQLARGRTLARSGRVRDLWFSPGLGSAEVVTNRESHRVTVRVRVFDDDEWDRLVEHLVRSLRPIAALLEGELPERVVTDLAEDGLALIPPRDDLDGVCECQDFHMPCAHIAAAHNVIAEALDGDPFLLLTLRGLTRRQLLARLRRAWGDGRPLLPPQTATDEDPPAAPAWHESPTPLAPTPIRVEPDDDAFTGVHALGPPPGQADLAPALEPLYDAGANAALELAYGEPPDLSAVAPVSRWQAFQRGQRAGLAPTPSRPRRAPPSEPPPARSLTEQLVDLLAELESARSRTLADRLGVTVPEIRQELVDLERMGIVYRTGKTRGTTWWLG